MGLPNKLININATIQGRGHIGEIAEFTEPKLVIKMEEHRAGGMLGPVMLDQGLEALEAEITMTSHVKENIRQFGTTDVAGIRTRLVGAYRRDDGTTPQAVEIYLGGRFKEFDMGGSKAGDDTEHKYMFPCSYYRRVVDGRTEIEIDMLAGIFIVDGVDRYGEITSILNG